jgi:hypothetical protein
MKDVKFLNYGCFILKIKFYDKEIVTVETQSGKIFDNLFDAIKEIDDKMKLI